MELLAILLFVVWIVGWGTVAGCLCLWLGWIPKGTSLLRILLCQLFLLPAYFLAVVLTPNTNSSPNFFISLIFNLTCISLVLFFVYMYILHTDPLENLGCTLLCLFLPFVTGYTFSPNITYASPSAQIAKAKANMRSLSEALDCYQTRYTELPLPLNQKGQPVSGIPLLSEDLTPLLYFVGPSFVPASLIEATDLENLPTDPFAEKKHGTYSYGMGKNCFGDFIFILSSPGPDQADESEELETLFLYVHEGNLDVFENDPLVWQLQYSPTNGTASPGGLYRAGVVREGGVWW